MLSQAVTMAYANEGALYATPLDDSSCTSVAMLNEKFQKYFKVTKKNIQRLSANPNYQNYMADGTPYSSVLCNSGFQVSDNMTIYISDWLGGNRKTIKRLIYFNIDTNGHLKGPNRWGFDLFSFAISPKHNMIKVPDDKYAQDTWFEAGASGSARKCCTRNGCAGGSHYNGLSCAYWASINKSQDDETKTYWENLPW